MPKQRGETEEQFMDRIRGVRGLPPMRQDPSIMDRTRAAVAYCNTHHNPERLKVFAFMAIFHPDVPDQRVRELVRAMKDPR